MPYSAAGVAGTVARILEPRMAEDLRQRFAIDNRTSASGAIDAQAVGQSPADGHMLLFEGATFATLQAVATESTERWSIPGSAGCRCRRR